MATVAMIIHQGREDADVEAKSLADQLIERGHDVRLTNDDAADLGLLDAAASPAEFIDGVDLVVSLGGDGSMLRAIGLAADSGVPVLGVNFGQLGYLTEVEPERTHEAVMRYLDGELAVEERMRVSARIERSDGSVVTAGDALNEAVVEKIQSGRTVRLSVSLDGQYFTTYSADGVICATPTGSTAYSLSARGPIVAPTHQALIVTPVSPHMLFDRSLVLAPESEVRIEVVSDRPASLTLDGRPGVRLEPGDVVVCGRSAVPGRFVVFRDTDFLSVLKSKFGLNER